MMTECSCNVEVCREINVTEREDVRRNVYKNNYYELMIFKNGVISSFYEYFENITIA